MDHAEARMLASARADGELDAGRAAELDEHLLSCGACRAFADAIPQLSALASALTRAQAPSELAEKVRRELAQPRSERAVVLPMRPTMRPWRAASALVAALVVALVAVVVGPLPLVRVPTAAAARALSRIGSLHVEREIRSFDDPQHPDRLTATVRESIWFRSPGLVRIETVQNGVRTIEIRRPGVRYDEGPGGGSLRTGLLPTNELPEPLSPTILMIGRVTGEGPVTLGRRTVRVEARFDLERREALLDAERFLVVGAEESVVLAKTAITQRSRIEKRTLSIEYNPVLPDRLFAIPPGLFPVDAGARPQTPGSIAGAPASAPEGLDLVSSVSGRNGSGVLYAAGAFQVLVTIDAAPEDADSSERNAVEVAGRPGLVVLSLYRLPQVRFAVGGHTIVVSAPLPPVQVVELAARLYPAGRE